MTTRNLRRIHRPIPTPLARALALSLAIAPGIGGAAATSHHKIPRDIAATIDRLARFADSTPSGSAEH